MRRFTDLYLALDGSTRTGDKLAFLTGYFATVPPEDAAWAVYFLTGRKLKRVVGRREIAGAALDATGIPEWLFDASYDAVGDLAETVALLLPETGQAEQRSLSGWVEQVLKPLAGQPPEVQRARLIDAWQRGDRDARFVATKLITGAFRVGTAKQLVYRGLATATGVPVAQVAQNLAGPWEPGPDFIERVRGSREHASATSLSPYPFFLAHALEGEPAQLGDPTHWQAEWKWDGVRTQLVVREGGIAVWSRGEELVSEAFPELVEAGGSLPPGTVIDGEVLVWLPDAALPATFGTLQRRLNRKVIGARLLREAPVVLCAYDLLEWGGADLRSRPLAERRARLEGILPRPPALRLSPPIDASSWTALAHLRLQSRAAHAEGLMLKRRDSAYGTGRVRGPWWKWKVDPYTVDAVLVYAQAGHGRRASLYTDYTFAVWHEGHLVPFAKAYSGLSQEEINRLDAWIRAHTIERFGPVRQVEPLQVFELAFEGLQSSPRHKSGIAVRFPRILRWRHDKPPAEADTLATLRRLAEG